MPKKKPPTAEESRHMGRVAAMGCIAAEKDKPPCGARAVIHHVRKGNKGRDHMRVLPLCPKHHNMHGHGVSLHDGVETWEAIYGDQLDYLEEVERRLKQENDDVIF